MAAEDCSSARKGATKHCCWGACNTDSRFLDKNPNGTFFIRFPKPGKLKDSMTDWEKQQIKQATEKCMRWVHCCGRKNFTINNITKDTYICSLHFVGNNGPTEESPDPLLATLTESEIAKKTHKRKLPRERDFSIKKKKRKQKNTKNVACNSDSLEINNIVDDTGFTEENLVSTTNDDHNNVLNSSTCTATTATELTTQTQEFTTTITTTEVATQTQELNKLVIAARVDNMMLQNELHLNASGITTTSNIPASSSVGSCMDMSVILQSETKTMYFIGLSPKHFWNLYKFLGPAKFNLKYWGSRKKDFTGRNCKLSIPEQLFITLMRLRRGFNLMTLAHFYDVSEYLIRTVFTTWIMLMFHHFKDLRYRMFPERQAFRDNLPKVFRFFKNIRASIDCTEFKCEMPRNYSQQGNLYSSYKSHCTMKCLIAVNPNGAACFVSDLFEGSINDVEIFQKCGLMEHINPNDAFLVDKGFTVQHLLLSKQATIFIPPFLGKRDKFTKEEVMLTKRIAKARIHVERFNERLKKFRLLDRIMPLSLVPIASQLVYVGCCIVNFQDCLCK